MSKKEKGRSNIKIAQLLLLIVWFLNKLGQLTSDFFSSTIKRLHTHKIPFKKLKKRFLHLLGAATNVIHWLSYRLHLVRRKGRPRTQPFWQFYQAKLGRFLDKIFPKTLRKISFAVIILGAIFYYSYVLVMMAHDLPDPKRLKQPINPITSEIYDRSGKVLYRFYEGRNRQIVSLDELPQHLVDATIAIEDKNFYSHMGIDVLGILRALKANYEEQDKAQGGSTITQQLIKNTLLTPEKSWERKIKEMLLALWTERVYSKQEILGMYLNEVAYGGPAWGVEAAAKMYFGKPAKDLNLAESAYLAGLPASPTTYSPYGNNPQLTKIRQGEVLRRMVEDRYITQAQADEAYKMALAVKPPTYEILAPHFVMYVRELLEQKYGEKMVSQGGLKIYTSLDLEVQEKAEKIVNEEVGKLADLQVGNGAALIMDGVSGQILAMVGSKDYHEPGIGNFNVTTALRQPGSAIKPITYATAFKQGYNSSSVLLDSPITFQNAWEVYAPVNYDGRFHGPVTIRTALGSSYNVPAVKMLAIVGLPAMLQTAKDLGITTLTDTNRYGLSLTLGAGEVRMTEMVQAYATFSQNGKKPALTPILKVIDGSGLVLEDNTKALPAQVLPEGVAFMINDILSDNKARTPAFGDKSLLLIPGHTVAVKTGTTNDKKDNWAIGYTPKIVIGAWVGNNNNKPMHPSLTSGVTGATPIWHRLMTMMLEGQPDIAFSKPTNLAELEPKREANTASKKPNKEITFTDPFSPVANP